MVKSDIKKGPDLLLNFSTSLSGIADTPGQVKCISLNNQQCVTQRTLINLHPNKYIEGLRYYPFVVKLDRCMCSRQNKRFKFRCF